MAQAAAALTRQRFGRTMRLFAPLYLSNRCSNICSYCGFSMHNAVRRITLDARAQERELAALKQRGLDEVLLLTGESERDAGVDYLRRAVARAKEHFSQVLIEVQPLSQADYALLVAEGLDGVVVYQESYHRPTYAAHHVKGRKRDFDWRLETAERAAAAGVERIGLGVLLGLADWRRELMLLGVHLDYLRRHHWRSRYQLALPRLRPCLGGAAVAAPVGDAALVQALCALRLFAPDEGIALSTRETPRLRDHLAAIGITHMSAGSHTEPGGYAGPDAGEAPALAQFEISDHRSPAQIRHYLRQQGLAPVLTEGWRR
jgi:2-iminoacetate synthase